MADTRMTVEERESFLAARHVGVLSIARTAPRAPLSAPVWYAFAPGADIVVLTGPDSLKGRLLAQGTAVTLVAQTEAPPYAYVSVEGTVSAIRAATLDDTRAMARRYLGDAAGNAYAEGTADSPSSHVSIRPERWLTVDYGKS